MWEAILVGLIVLVAALSTAWRVSPASLPLRAPRRIAEWGRRPGRPTWLQRASAGVETAARKGAGACSDCSAVQADPSAIACLVFGIGLVSRIDCVMAGEDTEHRYMLGKETTYSDLLLFSDDYESLSRLLELSPADLRIARNAVFAKHGYEFKDAELSKYFSQKPWYNPKPGVIIRLRGLEETTVNLITYIENGSSSRVLDQLKKYLYAEQVYWNRKIGSKHIDFTDVEVKIAQKKPLLVETKSTTFPRFPPPISPMGAGWRLGTVKMTGFLFSLWKKKLTCGTNISSPISLKKFSMPLDPSVI